MTASVTFIIANFQLQLLVLSLEVANSSYVCINHFGLHEQMLHGDMWMTVSLACWWTCNLSGVCTATCQLSAEIVFSPPRPSMGWSSNKSSNMMCLTCITHQQRSIFTHTCIYFQCFMCATIVLVYSKMSVLCLNSHETAAVLTCCSPYSYRQADSLSFHTALSCKHNLSLRLIERELSTCKIYKSMPQANHF